jgi:hypothetical protein
VERVPALDQLLAQAPPPEPAVTVAPELRRALAGLSLALGHALSEEQLAVYAYVLREVDLRWLRLACVTLARTETYWPKPAQIITRATELELDEEFDRRAKLRAALPPANEADPSTWVRCQNCADEGWLMHSCQGGAARTCGRPSKGHFVTDSNTKRTSYYGACRSTHHFAVRCTCAYLHRETS